MLRKITWGCILSLLVFIPSILAAQDMVPGKWWHDKAIINELNLTVEERAKLDEKYTESRRRMISLKGEVEKHRFELELLLDAEDIDKQKIMERYDSLERARTELSKQRFEMLVNVRETIGAERFQNLKFVHQKKVKARKDFLKDKKFHTGKDRN